MKSVLLVIFFSSTLLSVTGIVYTLFKRTGNQRAHRLLMWIVMLLCPIVGPLSYLISALYGGLMLQRVEPFEPSRYIPAVDPVIVVPDEATELNIVSMEEAMMISHKTDLRRMLLALLKNGTEDSLGAISMALSSEDSEASHYSASAIADALAAFHQKAYDLEKVAANGVPEDTSAMIEYLLRFVSYGVLPDREALMYLRKSYQAVQKLLEQKPSLVLPEYLNQINDLAVRYGDKELYQQSSATCAERFPDMLESYLSNLRTAFALGDTDSFNDWLSCLKASKVVINKQALDIIHTLG